MNIMNLDKVISGFFIILAMTLNFGFFYGDMHSPEAHSKYELFAAIIINIIATTLKLGDKTQLGSVLLATSLVADIQLIAAAIVWAIAAYAYSVNAEVMGVVVSLSGGALLANLTSVALYVGDTLKSKR
jgi:putative Ca2+/H+ antiporter (TMEM165/GDT1 family)